jgi:hypothetical protein
VTKKRKKADAKVEQAKGPEKSMIARIEDKMVGKPDPDPPIDLIAAGKRCGWENGLRGDLNASWSLVRYPVRGYGFSVTIQERTGRQRSATQRFDAEGRPTYYSLDSGGVPL